MTQADKDTIDALTARVAELERLLEKTLWLECIPPEAVEEIERALRGADPDIVTVRATPVDDGGVGRVTDALRYTLDDARRELVREECDTHGHDFDVIVTVGGEKPKAVICSRCGTSWCVQRPCPEEAQ